MGESASQVMRGDNKIIHIPYIHTRTLLSMFSNITVLSHLPCVRETCYCKIQFISVDKSCQGRSTDCAQSLELNKGGATPAIHNRVHVGIGVVIFTVSHDDVAGAVDIKA